MSYIITVVSQQQLSTNSVHTYLRFVAYIIGKKTYSTFCIFMHNSTTELTQWQKMSNKEFQ